MVLEAKRIGSQEAIKGGSLRRSEIIVLKKNITLSVLYYVDVKLNVG